MSRVLIFRTNINTLERMYRAARRLCTLDRSNCRWTIDLNDIEFVLRIETDTLTEAAIVDLLTKVGLQCQPLD